VELRETVAELHPSAIAAAGTPATLRAVAQQAARRGDFSIDLALPEDLHSTDDQLLISVARELLTNIARHASARHASLQVAVRNGQITLEVSDDGSGIQEDNRERALASGHVGLASTVERVEAVGGKVTITSPASDGRGTRVTVSVPQ
jgi:two-component system, NarL family, sensor kinase